MPNFECLPTDLIEMEDDGMGIMFTYAPMAVDEQLRMQLADPTLMESLYASYRAAAAAAAGPQAQAAAMQQQEMMLAHQRRQQQQQQQFVLPPNIASIVVPTLPPPSQQPPSHPSLQTPPPQQPSQQHLDSPDSPDTPRKDGSASSEAQKAARICKRREPNRSEYPTEDEFQYAWTRWRRIRDSNNQAVKKSRDKRRGIAKESPQPPRSGEQGEIVELKELVRVLATALKTQTPLSSTEEYRVQKALESKPQQQQQQQQQQQFTDDGDE